MEQRFKGIATHKVDAKGRVQIPVDFRAVLDAGDPDRPAGTNPTVTVCFGDDRMPFFTCYTADGVREMTAKIDEMDDGDEDREALEEYFYTYSDTVTIDDSGRLLVTGPLRDRIGVTDALTFAGRGKTFRIHSPDAPAASTSRLAAKLAVLPEGTPITSRLPRKNPVGA